MSFMKVLFLGFCLIIPLMVLSLYHWDCIKSGSLGMPIHLIKIDVEIPDTSSTWFVGQTIEQGVYNIQANLKSNIEKKSVPSLFASEHKVASPTELYVEEYNNLMAKSSTTPENPFLPVKSLKLKLSPESLLSVQLQQESIETIELLQPVKLVETPKPLELRQTNQSPKLVELMQLLESRKTSASVEQTSSQSQREKLISRLPAPIKLTPINSSDPMCLQCLSKLDKLHYDLCAGRRPRDPAMCRFINGSRRAPVALASFPGSGNTWVRGILEKATGICTGAVYCDKNIMSSGMYGESVRSGTVLVVKTHYRSAEWTEPDQPQFKPSPIYGGAIVIIRNPYDAFVAEWTRLSSGHTGTVTVKQFELETWNTFIKGRCRLWPFYIKAWVVNANLPTHVVRFEDLKTDTLSEVKSMLDYLNFDYDTEELKRRLYSDFGRFHRKHQEDFEHYTREQRLLINHSIADTIEYLRTEWTSTLGIEDYLWHD